ncbi:MAG: hypothetical protein ACXVCG_12795, partial [Bdellovibrionota bacterium]
MRYLFQDGREPPTTALPFARLPAHAACLPNHSEVSVRHIALWVALLCLPLLSGCGNANTGKAFTPFNYAKTSASQANSAGPTNTTSVPQLLFCHSPLLTSADATTAAAFNGSVLCSEQAANSATGTKSGMVRIKVNSTLPAGSALCAIPFVYDSAETETCFSVPSGLQLDFQLTTDQYTSVVVVAQSQLQAYKVFLSNPGALPPPRVLYS